ncbi:hypothetical protein K8O68_09460 [Salipaludibacillus sp. CUR1]|uniref:hypothetical protein n=1 Tax=Salipaludibacillus sp. CUR1 TaxID=2820003 RepID=UPI001E54306D|nr:hypothetical protein [Salipaludibacillus sp. CUR1]MCE7792641.1 hypothetical protein [Salipaludibacillus sp. CUR1]
MTDTSDLQQIKAQADELEKEISARKQRKRRLDILKAEKVDKTVYDTIFEFASRLT